MDYCTIKRLKIIGKYRLKILLNQKLHWKISSISDYSKSKTLTNIAHKTKFQHET